MSQQINLFNPALLRQKNVFTARAMLAALGLLLFGSLALLAYGQHSVRRLAAEVQSGAARLELSKRRQAQAQLDFAPRQKNPALERELAEAEAELAGLNEVMGALHGDQAGSTVGYAAYFKALARQSTGELWLTGVRIGAGGRQIALRGRALEPALVPAYVKRLTREPVMQGKNFGSLAIQRAVLPDAASGATPNGAPNGMPKGSPNGAPPDPARPAALAPYVDFSLDSAPGQLAPGAPK